MTKYVALLVLFPLLLKSSLILGWQDIDPTLTLGGVGLDIKGSSFPGLPTIDPNIGYTTQALGMRAAQDWWHGHVPWWNPYEGTGVPLAAEMQCAAFFLPFILMMAWPGGLLWFQLSLQIMAGLATFALLRRLNLGLLAALIGGLLYEVNGTFAWLATVADNPIPFLPLLLYGIETTRFRIVEKKRGGWGWIAAAVAWSLYSGFPETAYIDGLLAGVWSLARLPQLSWSEKGFFLGKLGLGCSVGVLLSLPILVPFGYHVLHSFTGGHAQGLCATAFLDRIGVAALFMPYLYGPIFAPDLGPLPANFWGLVGGYAGSALPILGLWSLWGAREKILRWALAGWVVVACLRTFGEALAADVLNRVPFLSLVEFFRYSPPSWELCLVVLTAFTIDDICRGEFRRRNYVLTATVGMALIGISLISAEPIFDALAKSPTAQWWFWGALAFAGTVGICLITLPLFLRPRLLAAAVSVVALSEAALLFFIPVLATPVSDRLDTGAVSYLSKNIGLHRFYSLGPFAPNYGSAFAIAQIDWNAVMIENHLVDYMHQNLDPNSYLLIFNGLNRQSPEITEPNPLEIFNQRIQAYEQAGVAYVIVPPLSAPARTLSPVQLHDNRIALLGSGESCQIEMHEVPAGLLRSLSIFLSNNSGRGDGTFRVRVTQGSASTEGARSLHESADNQFFQISFPTPMTLQKGPATVDVAYEGGTVPVGLWLWPLVNPDDQVVRLVGVTQANVGVRFAWGMDDAELPQAVYADDLMAIYALPHPRPYFSAPGCQLKVEDRNSLQVVATEATQLTRLESYYEGWTATVNGKNVPIERVEGLFQQIQLPPGTSQVKFSYRPLYLGWAMAGFFLGAVILGWEIRRSLQAK